MNSLAPLKVPRQLLIKKSKSVDSRAEDGGVACSENQTDQEKTVLRKTALLIEVRISRDRQVVDTLLLVSGSEADVFVSSGLTTQATPPGATHLSG